MNDLGGRAPATFSAFGLTLSSELPCPELLPGEGAPDVRVRFGAVPGVLPGAVDAGGCYQTAPGRALVTLDGIARFLICDGHTITIDPAPGVDDDTLRLFVLGDCMGVLLHQRGMFVLHASAVARADRCIVLAGPSAVGKSTLAAAFLRRGYALATDEVCAVSTPSGGRPAVTPAFPALLLWRWSLDHLGLFDEALPRVRPGLEKYVYPVPARFAGVPPPLTHLCVLEASNLDGFRAEPLKGSALFAALLAETFHEGYLRGMGLAPQRLLHCAAVAQHVRGFRLRYPSGATDLDEVVSRIEQAVLAAQPA